AHTRRQMQTANRHAEDVRGARADVAAADVDANDEAGVVADHVRHWAAAPAPVLLADGVDHAALLEPADRRRDGRLRQPGGGRDLRPSDRALAEDGLEHRLLAELAEQAQTRVRGAAR